MAKSGNTWFKIKRAKLKKQYAAAAKPSDAPVKDRVVPSCSGAVVTVCEPQATRTRPGRWRAGYVARVLQEKTIAAPRWGVGQSRLITVADKQRACAGHIRAMGWV